VVLAFRLGLRWGQDYSGAEMYRTGSMLGLWSDGVYLWYWCVGIGIGPRKVKIVKQYPGILCDC